MLTSTVSVAMIGGGQGHQSQPIHQLHHIMPDADEEMMVAETISMGSLTTTIHDHITPVDHTDNHSEHNMMLCNVCLLCSSVITVINVDFLHIVRLSQRYDSESTLLLSKFPDRFERPPRA